MRTEAKAPSALRAASGSVVESGAGGSPLAQPRRRMEARAELALVELEPLEDPRRAERVRVAQQPAAERREPDPHDEPQVHLARVLHYAVLQRAGGLVDHGEDGALLDHGGGDVAALGGDGVAQERVDAGVRLLLAVVLVAVVAESALAAEPVGL